MLKKIFVSIILFVFTSLIFGKFESSADGYTIIGFPFKFVQMYSGKCFDCGGKSFFKIHFLLIDILIMTMATIGIFYIANKLKPKAK